MEFNLGEPYGLLGAVAQLLIGIGVVGNMILGFLTWLAARTLKVKVAEVHDATNSMKDDLVEATKLAGESKGREDERREARERNKHHGP